MKDILVFDSATRLDASAEGRVVVCGSHGGLYAAWLAATARVRAVILNDAGIGKHSAGIAGVAWLGGLGIPACAVDYRSARIGDGADAMASGVVSTVNGAAAQHGCLPGHTCRQAATFTPSSGDRSPFAGIQYAGQDGIIRRNIFRDTVGPALDMCVYPQEARYDTGNRVYHNVFSQTSGTT